MGARVFVCDIEPRGDGRWDLWLSEEPYRGVETDAVCGALGERRRSGGTYTSRWFVRTMRTGIWARNAARDLVQKAERLAAERDAESSVWRANAQRGAMRVTNSEPTPATTPTTNPDPTRPRGAVGETRST